jgi:WD40 repeat protein
MDILEIGGDVVLLRFLPDSRRLVVGMADEQGKVTFGVLALPGGERVTLNVPQANLNSWWYQAWYGNAIVVHPSGEACYIAWAGRLYAFRTADGASMPVPEGVEANQVVLSPGGDRLLAAHRTDSQRQLFAVTASPGGGAVVWQKALPPEFAQVAGFLPDGERFVTVDGAVRIRSFATGDELAASRAKPVGAQQPQVSRDGRHLGLIGYASMYFWDLTTLEKPRKISGSSNFGDFRSFAFHPGGKTVAVIHGGPTLVKVYDLSTLKQVQVWKWKLGPLQSVAFSPDGNLGAAGSVGGRIVVWDVDE